MPALFLDSNKAISTTFTDFRWNFIRVNANSEGCIYIPSLIKNISTIEIFSFQLKHLPDNTLFQSDFLKLFFEELNFEMVLPVEKNKNDLIFLPSFGSRVFKIGNEIKNLERLTVRIMTIDNIPINLGNCYHNGVFVSEKQLKINEKVDSLTKGDFITIDNQKFIVKMIENDIITVDPVGCLQIQTQGLKRLFVEKKRFILSINLF